VNRAYLVGGVRTPIGRYGGVLAPIRPDDLAAHAIRELIARFPALDLERIDDVILGCANQAGEDNRNVARMAALIAGLPETVPGMTVNRLCASGMEAVLIAGRQVQTGGAEIVIAGGVESMSRAPFVVGKAEQPFSRRAEIFDTTIGWRFVNPVLASAVGADSMPETAENVAVEFKISRSDQDAFALRSQQRTAAAAAAGRLAEEIVPVMIPQKKGDPVIVGRDEHPRETTLEALAKLKGVVKPDGTVTAGNASGVNDGACAVLLASAEAVKKYGLKPCAQVIASATVGVPPRIMGFGPAPAMRKVLAKAGLKLADIDVIELNEAFASQALAVLRDHGIADDAPHVNPNGGAIALGHPLGASGARLVTTALYQLGRTGGRHALCTMCIGVGQGIAMLITRV
jgi:acetyl-CoA acyltransferase